MERLFQEAGGRLRAEINRVYVAPCMWRTAEFRPIGGRAAIGAMLTAARCAWLNFVEAHRFDAVLIALGGFLVLVLFSFFHERIGRLRRRLFQLAIAILIVAGLAAVIYEIQSPPECRASLDD